MTSEASFFLSFETVHLGFLWECFSFIYHDSSVQCETSSDDPVVPVHHQ